jgi:cell wall-associated NlpC family hydrolase
MRNIAISVLLAFLLAVGSAACSKTTVGQYGRSGVNKYAGAGNAVATGAAYVRPGQTAQIGQTRNQTRNQARQNGQSGQTSGMPGAAQIKTDAYRANSARANSYRDNKTAAAVAATNKTKPSLAAQTRRSSAKLSGDAICRTLNTQIGKPYKYGGYSPYTGFDCSGLVLWAYRQYGVQTPRTAREQASYGRSVSKNKLSPGDIVVFMVKGGYHTGVYVGNNSFIHSPRSGANVRVESLGSSYWSKLYYGARRFI